MVRSTALGGAVAFELNDAGHKVRVYAGGAELAAQSQSFGTAFAPEFRHGDALTGSWVESGQRHEPDPLGSEMGEFNPYQSFGNPDMLDLLGTGAFKEAGDPFDIRGGCMFSSLPTPCSSSAGP